MFRIAPAASLTALVLIACLAPTTRADDAEARQISAAYNQFGIKLFDEIVRSDSGRNVFISPASAAFALAMLYNGAAGVTEAEMKQVLELQGSSLDDANAANAALLSALNQGDGSVELAVANSIWYRNTFALRQDFLDRTSSSYDARIGALDFANPGSVDTVNGWVGENTRGRIKSIISQIDPRDLMFLVNAVYFKGIWTHPFRKEWTADTAFHVPAGTAVKVPMMQQTRSFEYFETHAFQAIRLPYGGDAFSMLLFLPAADYGLDRLVADVKPETWAEWRKRLSYRDVHLTMPRFKLEYSRLFNEPLIALGMESAFDSRKADFSRLWDASKSSDPGLCVSFVIQKTFLEVNEEGTEAAAATAIGLKAASIPPPPTEMRIDRPFLCAIVDDRSGLILFMGAIVDPS